jgi:hypothetical protein
LVIETFHFPAQVAEPNERLAWNAGGVGAVSPDVGLFDNGYLLPQAAGRNRGNHPGDSRPDHDQIMVMSLLHDRIPALPASRPRSVSPIAILIYITHRLQIYGLDVCPPARCERAGLNMACRSGVRLLPFSGIAEKGELKPVRYCLSRGTVL